MKNTLEIPYQKPTLALLAVLVCGLAVVGILVALDVVTLANPVASQFPDWLVRATMGLGSAFFLFLTAVFARRLTTDLPAVQLTHSHLTSRLFLRDHVLAISEIDEVRSDKASVTVTLNSGRRVVIPTVALPVGSAERIVTALGGRPGA